jgi:hypothetical protein
MPSSHSFGKTPLRKQRSSGADCDKHPQPRAEFRGKLYYEPKFHDSYNVLGLTEFTSKTSWNEMPYAKREAIPFDIPRSGVVTLADAHVVRQRNLPITLYKQLKEVGYYINPKLKEACLTLFPTGTRVYDNVDPIHRPKVGCIRTKFWTDHQVKTWGIFANAYGIKYSGRTEYQIPKGLLGIAGPAGAYYRGKHGWPKLSDPVALQPLHLPPSRGKRSEFSRIMRSLRKKGQYKVESFDFKDFLAKRKIYPRRVIKRLFWEQHEVKNFRQFRDSIPECLSVGIGPPLQVSTIIKRAAKSLASRAKKFNPDLPWFVDVVPTETRKPKYAPVMEASEKYRRIATLTTANGGQILNLIGPGPSGFLIDTFPGNEIAGDRRFEVLDNLKKWQDRLDDDPDKYSGQTVLGGWFD